MKLAVPQPPIPALSQKASWGAMAAILIGLVAFFVGQIIGAIATGVIGNASGQGDAFFDLTISQFIYVLIAEVVTIGLIIWYVRHRKGTLGMLGMRRPKVSDAGWAVIGFIVYFVIYIIAVTVIYALYPGFDVDREQDVGFNNVVGSSELLLTFLSLVIIVPIAEEILFRGFLYGGVRRRLPVIWAALITSLVFAAAHLPSGVGGLLWIGAVDTFFLSIVLCTLREHTGRIWAGVFVHAIKNGIAFTTLYIIGT